MHLLYNMIRVNLTRIRASQGWQDCTMLKRGTRHYVSNDMAVSPTITFACLGPGQETWTSLRALVEL